MAGMTLRARKWLVGRPRRPPRSASAHPGTSAGYACPLGPCAPLAYRPCFAPQSYRSAYRCPGSAPVAARVRPNPARPLCVSDRPSILWIRRAGGLDGWSAG